MKRVKVLTRGDHTLWQEIQDPTVENAFFWWIDWLLIDRWMLKQEHTTSSWRRSLSLLFFFHLQISVQNLLLHPKSKHTPSKHPPPATSHQPPDPDRLPRVCRRSLTKRIPIITVQYPGSESHSLHNNGSCLTRAVEWAFCSPLLTLCMHT